jgi:3-oxoacyl-[acyl-carrier-protein] synthase-3
MGTVIRASGISEVDNDRGSVEHATQAIQRCVEAAGIDLQSVDLLVNIGIYRDNNMCEPSMCSQIQHELGLFMEPSPSAVPGGTFSFDLMNGACGFLMGVKVVSAALSHGTAKRAIIVSSDAHPTGKKTPDFPHTHCGAAVLLEQEAVSGRGFGKILARTKDIGHDGARGMVNLLQAGNRSRYEIWVTQDDDYVEQLLALSLETASAYLEDHAIPPSECKLLTSQPSPDFARHLGQGLGIVGHRCLVLDEAMGDPHTSAAPLGYHLAWERGLIEEGDCILFVNAGSGLTVVCGSYVV